MQLYQKEVDNLSVGDVVKGGMVILLSRSVQIDWETNCCQAIGGSTMRIVEWCSDVSKCKIHKK